jgi:hypothetical protein
MGGRAFLPFIAIDLLGGVLGVRRWEPVMKFTKLRISNPEMFCLFCNHPAIDHLFCGDHICGQAQCRCPGFYAPFNSEAERIEWEKSIFGIEDSRA